MNAQKQVMIEECPRCGCDHPTTLERMMQKGDGEGDWEWWGMCPVVEQPVLVAEDENGNLSDE
ncbi:MAG: hypothetical protein ABEN55_00570 [Bradymonadaceae bacterium]